MAPPGRYPPADFFAAGRLAADFFAATRLALVFLAGAFFEAARLAGALFFEAGFFVLMGCLPLVDSRPLHGSIGGQSAALASDQVAMHRA